MVFLIRPGLRGNFFGNSPGDSVNRIFPAGPHRPMHPGHREPPPLYKGGLAGTVSLPGSILRRRGSGQITARKFGSGSGANTGGKYCSIALFLENKHFKRIQTVLFSGPLFCAKKGLSVACPEDLSLQGHRYDRNLNGVPGEGKMHLFLEKNTGICRREDDRTAPGGIPVRG